METLITFDELKERTIPDIIKQMVELAEGFIFDEEDFIIDILILFKDGHYEDNDYFQWDLSDITNSVLFPLLLHRAVEGWNKIQGIGQSGNIFINDDGVFINYSEPICYLFKNYLPCHLTACEMAIWDCLLNILQHEESYERDERKMY